MESNVATANVEQVDARGTSLVFPLRLYRFLHEAEEYHLSHVASFQPDGRSFKIHNRIEFASATSRWFSFSKYESFQRQLNIYGFKRILRGTDKGCYYHKNFIRGQYALAQRMKRIPLKKFLMHASSINHTPVTDVHEMAAGTSAKASPTLSSVNSQHIQSDIGTRYNGDIYNRHNITATNLAIQPNLQQEINPHSSSDQYVGGNNIISQYLRDTLTNSISTFRANDLASLLQTQRNIRGTNTPLPVSYDTNVSTLSVLQRLRNTAATPSVIDSRPPFSLPPTALASASHCDTSTMSQSLQELLDALTNHARLQSLELINRARLPSSSQMDLASLLLHLTEQNASGQNQLHMSRSNTLLLGTRPNRPNSIVNDAAIRDILLQQNRNVQDEQTIRNVLMLLQQQPPPNYR